MSRGLPVNRYTSTAQGLVPAPNTTSGRVLLDTGWSAAALVLAQGSFTGTFTGFAAAQTATFNYTIIGNVVTLSCLAGKLATSNATTMTITGLPTTIRPTSSAKCVAFYTDQADSGLGGGATVSSAGIITCSLLQTGVLGTDVDLTSTAFTASGSKGLDAGWCITYPLS